MSDTSGSGPRPPYSGTGDPNVGTGPVYTPTPDEDAPPPPDNPGIQFDLDRDFGDVGEPVSDADALRILSRRLKGSATTQRMARQRGGETGNERFGGNNVGQIELARKLLAEIPANLRTAAVLEGADMRPLLDQVAWKRPGEEVAGLTQDQTLLAGHILLDETDRIRAEAEKAILPLVAEGDTQAMVDATQLVDKITNGYRDGTSIRIDTTLQEAGTGTLATDPTTGQVVATGGVSAAGDSFGLDLSGIEGEEVEAGSFLTREEVQYMAREGLDGQNTIGNLLGEDFLRRNGGPNGEPGPTGQQFELLYDDTRPTQTYNIPKSGAQQVSTPNSMTAREVVDLPSTMSRAEIHSLGKKLKDAGLMTEDMTDPTDFSDPSFKRAWQNLMYKAIERGESMLSVLDQGVKARREAQEDAYAPLLTDPARIRMNADALGNNILGRAMNPDEQEAMVQFVHQLERRNAKIEAGFDPDAEGDLADLEGEAIQADLEARMTEWIRTENPDEAGGKDVADSYDTLSQLLGGPGQPGLVR